MEGAAEEENGHIGIDGLNNQAYMVEERFVPKDSLERRSFAAWVERDQITMWRLMSSVENKRKSQSRAIMTFVCIYDDDKEYEHCPFILIYIYDYTTFNPLFFTTPLQHHHRSRRMTTIRLHHPPTCAT